MAMRMMAGQCPDGMGRLLSNVLYLLMRQGAAATLLALQHRPDTQYCVLFYCLPSSVQQPATTFLQTGHGHQSCGVN